jgi:hypothetical protein
MIVAPFVPEHAQLIVMQPRQEMPPLTLDEACALEKAGPAYTALDDEGKPVAICGVILQWPGRGIAWGLISAAAGPHFLRITREVRKFLDGCDIRRIEASADATFPQTGRWLELLGFECETPRPMRGYGFDGRACFLYARVASDA